MIRKSIYYILLLFIVIPATISAQTRYLVKTVNINVPTVLDLQLVNGTNPIVDFNVTGKIDNGIELVGATTFTYRSNKSWFITIRAGSADFTGGVAGSPMPASIIKYRLNGSGMSYTPLSNSAQTLIATSSSKSARGTGSASIDFFVDPGYNYPPSQNYSLQIIYTISNL